MEYERAHFGQLEYDRLCRDVGATYCAQRGFPITWERGTFPSIYVVAGDSYLVRIPKETITSDDLERFAFVTSDARVEVELAGMFATAARIRPISAVPPDGVGAVEQLLAAAFARHGLFAVDQSDALTGLEFVWGG